MSKIERLHVFYHGRKVGTMMLYRKRLTAFEYDNTWLIAGFPISPFFSSVGKKVFLPKVDPFEGLFGVFADSPSRRMGRLLVDR